ncbi:hypothetical protein FOA52_015695 [Chlamydomonas sp. UWO 241]|nr:hypothetical protein FOA52_015695 [Chlamydomonas sp. UWO 241]
MAAPGSLFKAGGGGQGPAIAKYALIAVALGVAIWGAVELSGSSGPSSMMGGLVASSGGSGACRAQPESYKIVQLPGPSGELQLLAMEQAVDYVKVGGRGNLGDDLPKFYGKNLCSVNGTKGCEGLVLDVGAFLGTHSLYLASLGYEVHAFEIQSTAADLLRCSAAANKLDNLHVTSEGISDENGVECMLAMWAGPAETQMVPKHLSENASTTGCTYPEWTKVPVVTLDHYWNAVLKKRQVLFIKIDVEGHEDLVLQGGKEMFAAAPPPFMLVEYNHNVLAQKGIDFGAFLQRIFDNGYHVYDCQMQEMVAPGEFGISVLTSTYAHKYGMTDLLLIQKDTFLADYKDKGAYVKIPCGQDESLYKQPVVGSRTL